MVKRKIDSTEQSLNRMKAANDRTRIKVTSDSEFDISFAPLRWWRERWNDLDIQRMFIENFIYIRDKFDENKLKLLKFNDVQIEVHYSKTGKDSYLKARQQGLSTYWQAMFFANSVVMPGREVREVPHDPDTEAKFRANFKIMYENLPPHLKPETRYYSDELIHFHDPLKGTVDSRITTATAQPGHEGKGRGQTISDLHATEIPFWRGDSKKQATSLLEAAQKGNIVFESTANGIEYFHSVYQQGKKKKGGWTSHFFEWWWKREYRIVGARFEKARNNEFVLLLPHQKLKDVWQVPNKELSQEQRAEKRNRFEEAKVTKKELEVAENILLHLQKKGYALKKSKWFCDEVAEYIAWRRAKIEELDAGEAEFSVEYPENDEDCFENTGNPVISPKVCKVTCEPSEPIEGREYLIGCDTSRGYSHGDPMAIEILDLLTGRQCYSEELRLKPDNLAYRLQELSDKYNWAIIAVERNNTGVAVLQELLKLVEIERIFKEIPRRLMRQVEDHKKSYEEALEESDYGIETTSANRGLMATYLERDIRNGEIGLSSKEWCEQAKTVVWFDNGSWGAMTGYHDDRFIALAIANYVRNTSLGSFLSGIEVLPQVGDAR